MWKNMNHIRNAKVHTMALVGEAGPDSLWGQSVEYKPCCFKLSDVILSLYYAKGVLGLQFSTTVLLFPFSYSHEPLIVLFAHFSLYYEPLNEVIAHS